ncbi:MAG: choice-of-anchor E domain-containing protein [Chitinophagaceae bacterium]
MKSVLYFVPGIVLSMFIQFHANAQCSGGATAYSITYDTVVYNSGSGNYSSSYSFSFPKFNIPSGTFIGVDIKSSVSIGYSYTISNTDTKTLTYKTRVYRNDDITSSALDPSDISTTNSSSQLTTTLAAGQVYNYGPALTTYTSTSTITAADSRLINFMGTGNVDFDYEAFTYPYIITSGTPGLGNINLTSATDTTHFSITYRYCMTSILAEDLLFFTAVPQAKGKVLLSWSQENIQSGRVYNAQVSTDGRNFTNIASVTENNTGNYAYTHLHNNTTRLYYRIEERDINGVVKYSVIRIIDPEQSKTGLQVYPTLYQGGNIQLGFSGKADWQIEFYSAEGRKVFDSFQKDAYNAQVSLPSTVSNGVYTITVINKQTLQREVARIIIQR